MSKNRKWALLIGIGITLYPIHNMWLADILVINGESIIFLPVFGTVIWILATLFFIRDNFRSLTLGDRKIYIPLLIIVLAIALSGITADGIKDKIAPAFMGLSLFSLYLVSRVLGKDMFIPLAAGSLVASLLVVAHSAKYPGLVTGGYLFEANYDIVVGYVLLGTALFVNKHQITLISISLTAMFLSGSPEAVVSCGVLGFVVLIRRDWSRQIIGALLPLLVVASAFFILGYGQQMYSYVIQIVKNESAIAPSLENIVSPDIITTTKEAVAEFEFKEDKVPQSALEYRVEIITNALTNIKPFGEGYNLTEFSKNPNVHNVPLILVQQLGYMGILAGLAWLWITIYCLVKTRWKYSWALIIALSCFDHYIWTQLAPVWWMLVGVSLTSEIKTDRIFNE